VTGLGRIPIIVAIVALTVGSFSASAQSQPAVIKPIRVELLNLGMDKNEVLASLAANYTLEKEDLPVPEREVWVVEEKTPKANSTWYEIDFSKNKLDSINAHMRPMLYGDAVRLAKELFSRVSYVAEPPKNPDKISSMLNAKWAVLPVRLQEITIGEEDTQQMFFNFGDSAFVIDIKTKANGPASVHLRQVRSASQEASKK